MARYIAAAALAAVFASGCAQSAATQVAIDRRAAGELDRALAGRVAGTPVNCVRSEFLNGPQVIDSRTIVYRESGRRVWRVDLPGDCPGLDSNSLLIVEQFGSQLCSDDRFRVVERGTEIPGAFCRFGKFTPYTKAR